MEFNSIVDTIQQGNCIDILKQIPEKTIDLIFADPPYNMQTEGDLIRTDGSVFKGVNDNWDKFNSLQDYDNFCKEWLVECKRVLKDDGAIWVIGSFQNIFRLGYIMQDLGFWILNDVIWSKPNAVPNFAGTRFQNAHETLIWCSKFKGAKYHFNYKTMKEINGGRQMKSVWENISICIGRERLKNNKGEKVHNTQKPEQLLYDVILSSTDKGDVVLDPFFGTGTTGVVAKRIGRHYIGIEMNSYYIEHAQKRISNTQMKMDIFSSLDLEVKPPQISMRDLIKDGLLNVGQILMDKDQQHKVELLADGHVTNGLEKLSIHKMSSKFLGKSNNNGWDYFWTNTSDGLVSIDSLRYKAKSIIK